MNQRHAVLFYPPRLMPNTAIMWIEGKGFSVTELPDPCYTLRDLANVAYKGFVTHLWVMPSYGEFESQADDETWRYSPYKNRRKNMMGAAVRRQGHREIDVNIIFPQHTSWWGTDKAPGWMRDAGPHDFLIVLHYLEQCLGITVTGSPGRTGWNYLKKLHPAWVEDIPGIDLRNSHFTSVADLIWQRALLTGELGKLYLHKFDKGGAYPYASTQTDIGIGTPVHVKHGYDARHEKGHPQAVGVWKCTVVDVPKLATYDNMPPPWDGKIGKETWLAGPVIRLLQAAGYNVGIDEGWVFPERHNVLAKWAENLWNIRRGFSDQTKWINRRCAELAAKATKQIMNSTIGMTAFKGFDDDDGMKRPDIRFQVIARHRELTWHNIDKIRALYGVTPCIVYMDAVYYLSDEPDGRKAFPELVKREGQFGGFRWEGRIPMTQAHIILDAKVNEADKLEQLNKIGWTR